MEITNLADLLSVNFLTLHCYLYFPIERLNKTF